MIASCNDFSANGMGEISVNNILYLIKLSFLKCAKMQLFIEIKIISLIIIYVLGGLENAVSEAFSIGARSFAMFLRNQRQWASKPLTEESIMKFKSAMEVIY